AVERGGDEGHAGLVEEGRERGGDVVACLRADGGEEVGGGGGAVGARDEVPADAVAEAGLAEVALPHADHAGALRVRDLVEGVLDVVLGPDGLADEARAEQG